MAVLSSKARKKLPSSTFGLPAERKYPMPDATQQVKAGNLSPSQKAKIDAKANKILKKKWVNRPAIAGLSFTSIPEYLMGQNTSLQRHYHFLDTILLHHQQR